MNEQMKQAWLEISRMLGEPTREELDVFLRTWQRASQATREALAEQPAQQEPVAYGMWDTMLGKGNRMMMVRLDKGQDDCTVPLYTSPQAQRTWVGLTDEEKRQLFEREDYQGWLDYINAIEAKLKEKNT